MARVDSEVEATRDDAECFDQDRLGADVEMLMIDAERLERERLAVVDEAVRCEGGGRTAGLSENRRRHGDGQIF